MNTFSTVPHGQCKAVFYSFSVTMYFSLSLNIKCTMAHMYQHINYRDKIVKM